jgi:hypothetical protein
MTGHAAFEGGGVFPLEEQPILTRKTADAEKISALREKVNDEEYLYEAIQRIALIMSNEISGATKRPGSGEGKRR